MGVLRGEPQDLRFLIEDQALGDNAPMAEVAGDFQAGQAFQDVAEKPGIVAVSAAVCLHGNREPVLLLKIQNTGMEKHRLIRIPTVVAAHGVDENGVSRQAPDHAFFQ